MRLRTIFLLAVVVCVLSSSAIAGGSTQANWFLRVDSTNAAPITTGSISAVSQLLQGLTINSWGGITSTSATNTTQISTSQRMYVTNATAGYWPGESALVPGRFAQYVVAPLTGTAFTVDSISMCLGDNIGNNTMQVSIYYYVGTDTTNFLTNATKLNSSTQYTLSVNIYQTPVYSSISTPTLLPISVPSGKNLYLRVYPFYSVAKTGKYVEISNVTIAGSTSPAIGTGFAVVTTTAASYISTTYLTTGGRIWADSGGTITARGVCWNTSSPATIGTNNYTTDGTGTGSFTSSVIGLTAGTTYHIRSYATNSKGTSYGNDITVTTYAAVVVPTVTTNTVSSIGVSTALSGGKIIDWGGAAITVKGLCWGTSANPTLANSYTNDGTDITAFTRSMSGLSAATLYHVRAYATNSAGTGFGGDSTFTTAIASKDSTVVVAKDGSGNYTTVSAALRNVPSNYTGKWMIFVKKGIYFERDTVLATSYNVNLVGEDRDSTVITNMVYSDDPAINKAGTGSTYTFLVLGYDFVARNITFQNTYWPNRWGTTGNTQAVAVMTNGGDRHEFINCVFRGYQDTYYAGGGSATTYGRAYFKKCIITGTVDFIFGRGICVFDSCTTLLMTNAGAAITAASTESSALYGLVFRNCKLTADTLTYTDSCGYSHVPITKFFLGRPWQSYPRTVYLHCNEPAMLAPSGWTWMQTNPTFYAEYNCTGAGAIALRTDTTDFFRWPSSVWPRQLTSAEAATYSLSNIYAKNSSSSTNITYDWMPTNAAINDNMPFVLTSVNNASSQVPTAFALHQNYPNPFNPSTTISYDLPRSGMVSLKVYDLLGREVATLTNGMKNAGSYREVFDGSKLASGVYFARLKTDAMSNTIKLIMMK
ncbi:MAG: pectinesterase family protein [Bacteroidota bacterium]